ncbi:hypothetical protein DFJ73DRAFT_776571 [Zopfochytrium polystomum]|nr:hypothetical protein DFJ73DRAFT_776571 [Zopfochytrium polystomum]
MSTPPPPAPTPPGPARQHILIIGAGVGGVSTAALLARAGHRVTVLEKNPFSGGRCSTIARGGFRFDQGPSLFLMPPSFRALFDELGERMEERVTLLRCGGVSYVVHFGGGEDGGDGKAPAADVKAADGVKAAAGPTTTTSSLSSSSSSTPDRIYLSSDLVHMRTELQRFEAGAFDGFVRFLRESGEHYDMSVEHVLNKNYGRWTQLLDWTLVPLALRLHVLSTVWGRACRYFKSDKLRRAFTFQTMYLGMSPYDAPGTFNLLAFAEYSEGLGYGTPAGGFHKVVEAIENIAKKHGAEFQFSVDVQKVAIDPATRRATGVHVRRRGPDGELVAGETEFIAADAVVCNADLIYAYRDLIEHPALLSFYWGLRATVPGLEPHNIFLADEDYRMSFDAIFKHGRLPDQPSFYVHCPTKLDRSLAPEGKECVVVLVPTGHLSNEDAALLRAGSEEELAAAAVGGKMDVKAAAARRAQVRAEWGAMQTRARRFVLDLLRRKLGVDVEPLIEVEETNTPLSWMDKFNLEKGSALGLSHPISQVLWFRPRTRHAVVGNLFFVGASTHPGTGVPIVIHSARLVARQVAELAATGFRYAMRRDEALLVVLMLAAMALAVAAAVVASAAASGWGGGGGGLWLLYGAPLTPLEAANA